ncbi:GNAT family N-acetyltransferase [Corticibacterium sp. UT-5YL-CI-8]|nr:GNAT family N-acetyltransferase [Tianweitania sp. UT-5YL-CI-8]
MSIEVRRLTERDELAGAVRTFRTAMTGLPPLGAVDDAMIEGLFEPGRAFGAFHDGQLVGTTNSYSGEIRVPGNAWLPHAAVTHVGVLPTHVRRGVAKTLLHAQLRAARESGEPLATLRATEAGIYGNFGYAIANLSVAYEIDRARARLRPEFRKPSETMFVEPDQAWALQARVYASQPDPRSGTISRPRYWWSANASRLSRSAVPTYVVAHGRPGQETGYVRYRPLDTSAWVASTNRTIVVDDLIAHDDETYAALISHLLSVDIAHRIQLPVCPADDLLPWLFTDWRSASVTNCLDETWLRLLDTQKALAGRSYEGPDAVVVEIIDPILTDNTVRLRITADGVGRTHAAAQIVTDVATASTVYLGGAKWWQMQHLRRLQVADASAVAALDRLFSVQRLPFSGTMF